MPTRNISLMAEQDTFVEKLVMADEYQNAIRWIEPYWKGPDIAAVVERAYRLKP